MSNIKDGTKFPKELFDKVVDRIENLPSITPEVKSNITEEWFKELNMFGI